MTPQPPEPALRRPVAAVIGDGGAAADSAAGRIAQHLGHCLVDAGFRVVTGGLGGVMAAASRGARHSPRYREGDVLAILPGYQAAAANPWADIVLCTGLGHARNTLCAASGDVVLAVGGGSGTLAEIALAWTLGRPVACVGTAPGWATELTRGRVPSSDAPEIAGPLDPEAAALWALAQLSGDRRQRSNQ